MRHIALLRSVHRYWRMANDPRTPVAVKYLIIGGVAFAVMPKNWLPERLRSFSGIEDVAIVPTVIAAAMMLIPREVHEDHAADAEAGIARKQAAA